MNIINEQQIEPEKNEDLMEKSSFEAQSGAETTSAPQKPEDLQEKSSEAQLIGQLNPKKKRTRKKKQDSEGTFRISAKRVFLTYSQVPEEITVDQVLCQLSEKLTIHKHLIAEERHKDGGKHFHVLLESKTKFNIRDPKALDISLESDSYHGNYQAARDYKSVARYVGKDSHYVTNYTNFIEGEFLTVEEDMLRISPELGVDEAAQYYLTNYTKHALKGMSVRSAKSIIKSIKSINNAMPSKEDDISVFDRLPFELQDFNLTPKLQSWIAQDYLPTLLLVGEGGTGKTAFCKALAKANDWKMLICNHLEGLKDLTPEHDLIVYDDLSFKDIDEQQLLAIVANDEEKTVRVLNGSVKKPQGIKQIMTLNTNVLKRLKHKFAHKQFMRRFVYVQLNESMIVNVNVNVEVNNHTNIYNNPQNIKDNEQLFDIL